MKSINKEIEVVGTIYMFPHNRSYTSNWVDASILKKYFEVVEFKPTIDTLNNLGINYRCYDKNNVIVFDNVSKLSEDMNQILSKEKSSFLEETLDKMVS